LPFIFLQTDTRLLRWQSLDTLIVNAIFVPEMMLSAFDFRTRLRHLN